MGAEGLRVVKDGGVVVGIDEGDGLPLARALDGAE